MLENSLVFHSLRESSLVDPNRLNEYYYGKSILIYDEKGNLVDHKFEQVLLYTNRDDIEAKHLNDINENNINNQLMEGSENVTKKQKIQKIQNI